MIRDRCSAGAISLLIAMIPIEQPASATAIAVVRTPTEIVMAADSHSVDEAGKPDGNSCKIREVAGSLFVINGLANDRSGLDVPTVAEEALSAAGTFGERVAKFDDSINGPLQSAVNRIIKNDSP